MNKSALIDKIKELEGLSNDEKSALLGLLRSHKKYGLVWEDKPEDVEERLKDSLPVLTEVKERAIISDSPDAPNHILIEGDNLEALTALSYTHEGKVDVIYIDPPYNTGKKDEFKYNDRFVDAEDDFRHSKWLSFMHKRLKIAFRLLSENGVIFISIDDNEIAQLKCLCDEIFNIYPNPKEGNFLGVLVWNLGTGTQAGHFTRSHEYVLAYAKNKQCLPNFSGGEGEIDHSALKKISKKNPPVEYTFKAGTKFLAPDGTELVGSWGKSETTEIVSGRMVAENQKLKYDVTLRAGFAMIKQMKSWFKGEHTLDTKGQVVTEFYFNSTGVLHYKKEKSVINPSSVLSGFGSTKTGSTELANVIGEKDKFGYPKPSNLLSFLIGLKKDAKVILDFFAGSGTTLHSTMILNNEDAGNRSCIIVTNNENNICEEVTYKRVQNVIKGYAIEDDMIEPLKNNTLRYYRTSLLSRERTMPNMRKLVSLATDMLCIKEDLYREEFTFGKLKLNAQIARYFNDGKHQMLVIYREEVIRYFVDEIEKMSFDGKLKVYLFAPDRYAFDDDFFGVSDKVQLCALPAAIYDAYQKVLPKHKPKYVEIDELETEDKEDSTLF